MMEDPGIDCIVCDDGLDLEVGEFCTNCGRTWTQRGMVHEPDKGSKIYREGKERAREQFREIIREYEPKQGDDDEQNL
jgi:hypothetical protein